MYDFYFSQVTNRLICVREIVDSYWNSLGKDIIVVRTVICIHNSSEGRAWNLEIDVL